VTAAQLLISWSHPGRLRSEAAFAMLAGVAPIEASSGQVVRHRLNRGGDRQLNRALHTIVMIRQRYHQTTKTYTTRRTAEGKSKLRSAAASRVPSLASCFDCWSGTHEAQSARDGPSWPPTQKLLHRSWPAARAAEGVRPPGGRWNLRRHLRVIGSVGERGAGLGE
jgi:Transposase IS116/IS110/IS902 family